MRIEEIKSRLGKDYLFVSFEKMKEYEQGPTITLPQLKSNGRPVKVGKKIMMDLLQKDELYHYVEKLMQENGKRLLTVIVYQENPKTVLYQRVYSFSEIVDAFQIIRETEELSEEEKRRVSVCLEEASFEKIQEKYRNVRYEAMIEGKLVSVPILDFVHFLSMSDEEYQQFMDENTREELVSGTTKETFLYLLNEWFIHGNLVENCVLSKDIYLRMGSIYHMEDIDFEALNRYLTTQNAHLHDVVIHPELKKAVYEKMPKQYNLLEKAIYIYIRLCDLLTYGNEFLSYDQRGKIVEVHNKKERIQTITPENNEVVCWEFNTIYGKFLEALGIHFHTNTRHPNLYGAGHESLTFRYQKYLVKADSLSRGIIGDSDLNFVKYNVPLIGIQCVNENKQSSFEFDEVLERVYQEYQQIKRDMVSYVKDPVSLKQLLEEYRGFGYSHVDVRFLDRLELLFDLMQEIPSADWVDQMGYVRRMINNIFSTSDKATKMSMTFVRMKYGDDNKALLIPILAINPVSLQEDPIYNRYFQFDPKYGFHQVSKEEIVEKLKNGTFEMHRGYGIPGINERKEEYEYGREVSHNK